MKSPIAYFKFFDARLVKYFTRQKVAVPKTKKHTICKNDMFYVHGIFSTNGMKIKEIEAYWRFCMYF
jgi:hypothetical protein